MRFIFTRIISGGLLVLSTAAPAQLPDYDTPVLVGRSGPSSGFRMPAFTDFSNATVSLNDDGEVAITLVSVPTTPDPSRGLWFGDAADGDVVVLGDGEWLFSDVTTNNLGELVWPVSFSDADGIYAYDPVAENDSLLTTQPLGASGWSSTQIDDLGRVGYRASFASGRVWTSWTESGGAEIHLAETAIEPGSPYAFLFTPAFNENRRIAGKARRNSTAETEPDELLITDETGAVQVVREDVDGDPTSPYATFDNGVGLNDNDGISFVAELDAGGARTVQLADGAADIEIAREGVDGVGEIEFFGTRVNNNGLVAFRAFDDTGTRAIWVGDGSSLQPVVQAGDIVDTDIGPARIESAVGGPEFSGGIDLNENGDLAFVASLTDPDNPGTERGRGIFVVPAQGEVIFADGFES